jgi:hypothetical protein
LGCEEVQDTLRTDGFNVQRNPRLERQEANTVDHAFFCGKAVRVYSDSGAPIMLEELVRAKNLVPTGYFTTEEHPNAFPRQITLEAFGSACVANPNRKHSGFRGRPAR